MARTKATSYKLEDKALSTLENLKKETGFTYAQILEEAIAFLDNAANGKIDEPNTLILAKHRRSKKR